MLSVWCNNSYLKNHNLTELKLIKPVISFPFFLRLTLFLQNKFSHVTESALKPLVHLCSGLLFLLPSQEMSTGRKQRVGRGGTMGFHTKATRREKIEIRMVRCKTQTSCFMEVDIKVHKRYSTECNS